MTEQAVFGTLNELTEAWNAGDATAYARLFLEDADYVNFMGQNSRGRAAIEESHRFLFDGPLKGSKMTCGTTPPTVRFVRPDVAIVVIGGGTSLDGAEEEDPSRASTVTFVLVEEPAGWRIASFQNTRRTSMPS